MKDAEKERLLFCSVMIIATILFFLIGIKVGEYVESHREYNLKPLIECQMQLPSNEEALKDIDGIAFGDKYFCIKTQGQTYSEVMEDCNHEWQHTSRQMEDTNLCE